MMRWCGKQEKKRKIGNIYVYLRKTEPVSQQKERGLWECGIIILVNPQHRYVTIHQNRYCYSWLGRRDSSHKSESKSTLSCQDIHHQQVKRETESRISTRFRLSQDRHTITHSHIYPRGQRERERECVCVCGEPALFRDVVVVQDNIRVHIRKKKKRNH